MVKGHCMRCKEKRDMKDARIEKTSRGGFIAKGACVKCSTNMSAIMSEDNALKAVKEGVKKSF